MQALLAPEPILLIIMPLLFIIITISIIMCLRLMKPRLGEVKRFV